MSTLDQLLDAIDERITHLEEKSSLIDPGRHPHLGAYHDGRLAEARKAHDLVTRLQADLPEEVEGS